MFFFQVISDFSCFFKLSLIFHVFSSPISWPGPGHQFLPSVWEQITQVCPLPLFSSVHRFRYIEIHHHHHYSSPSSQSPSLSALYATGCQYTKHPHRSRINMFWFWTFYIILACYKITYRISLILRDTPITDDDMWFSMSSSKHDLLHLRWGGGVRETWNASSRNIYIGQHRQHHDH